MVLPDVQSVQQVLGQVSALTWALTVDPNLFVAGSEVVSAAKEAFALADRDEVTLLQRLVRGDWSTAIRAETQSRHSLKAGIPCCRGCLGMLVSCVAARHPAGSAKTMPKHEMRC